MRQSCRVAAAAELPRSWPLQVQLIKVAVEKAKNTKQKGKAKSRRKLERELNRQSAGSQAVRTINATEKAMKRP